MIVTIRHYVDEIEKIVQQPGGGKQRELRLPKISPEEQGPSSAETSSVQILAPEACPRYVGRVLEGVRVGLSPFWLRRLLSLVGIPGRSSGDE